MFDWIKNLFYYHRYRDSKLVRKTALEYHMPDSYIRQMFAIEDGDIDINDNNIVY